MTQHSARRPTEYRYARAAYCTASTLLHHLVPLSDVARPMVFVSETSLEAQPSDEPRVSQSC